MHSSSYGCPTTHVHSCARSCVFFPKGFWGKERLHAVYSRNGSTAAEIVCVQTSRYHDVKLNWGTTFCMTIFKKKVWSRVLHRSPNHNIRVCLVNCGWNIRVCMELGRWYWIKSNINVLWIFSLWPLVSFRKPTLIPRHSEHSCCFNVCLYCINHLRTLLYTSLHSTSTWVSMGYHKREVAGNSWKQSAGESLWKKKDKTANFV